LGNGSGTTYVKQKDRQAPTPAELPGDICGPGVSAELVPRVTLAKHFEQKDGEID
jgi:hypothetical protein